MIERVSLSGSATAKERVLLLVSGERDRDLLRSWLTPTYEVVTPSPDAGDDLPDADLCVLDERWYGAVADRLAPRRNDGAMFPVLVLAREARAVPEHADDVVVLPTRTELLASRVESLLRARRLSAALEREREQFRSLADSANDAIITVDESSTIKYVNAAVEDVFGYEPSELLDEPLMKLMDAENATRHLAAVGEYLRSGDRGADWSRLSFVARHADGHEVPIEVSFSEYPTEEGRWFTGIVRDVSERLELEQSLREERDLFEDLFQNSPVGIVLLDTDGQIVRANETAEEVLGLERSAIAGRTYDAPEWDITDVRGDEIPADDLPFSRAMHGERVRDYRHAIQVEGERRWLSVNATPRTEDGEVVAVLTTVQDITEQVDRERRLTVLDRVLRHNLRNKLNVVLANARMLVEHDDGETAALADEIVSAADDLLSLSEGARKFESAIQPREGSVESREVAGAVDRVVKEAELSYDVGVDTDLDPRARARAHETFELAVGELIENAILHADGEPSVSVTVRDRPEADVVEVRVADEGPGIPEMEREVLLRGSETPLAHMQGLGLWFVHWTVTASGGSVQVEDNEPRGTVVMLDFPRVDRSDE